MNPCDPYRLSRNDVAQGAAVLARAFIEYPTFTYLFPNAVRRGEHLEQAMRFFIRCGLLRGQVLAPSPRLEAVAIWYRSSDLAFGLNTVIRAGAASLLRGLGWSTFARFKELGDAKKVHRDRIMQEEKYWFLDVIGVDPAQTRRGFGRCLIEPTLAQADREGCACYLETSDRNNLGLYERFGFCLCSTYHIRELSTFVLVRTPLSCSEIDGCSSASPGNQTPHRSYPCVRKSNCSG